LILAAKGHALLQGRYAVIPDDIKKMMVPALRHRVILNFRSMSEKIDVLDVIQACLRHSNLD